MMRTGQRVFALIASVMAAAAAEKSNSAVSAAPKSTAPVSQPATAAVAPFGEPSLNKCAGAMEGIAWNGCDRDVDGYVYEEGKSKPLVFRIGRDKQRTDIPAGMRRTTIFCPAGWHPVNPETGAVLEKPGHRFRCAGDPKP